jgi:hypothetical protein
MQTDVEERWLEARQRIHQRIDALLWQDLGVASFERDTYVDWLLDEFIKDEYIALLTDDWTVWRQDDEGNYSVVQASLSYKKAKSMVKTLEAREDIKEHKQAYWFEPSIKPGDSAS